MGLGGMGRTGGGWAARGVGWELGVGGVGPDGAGGKVWSVVGVVVMCGLWWGWRKAVGCGGAGDLRKDTGRRVMPRRARGDKHGCHSAPGKGWPCSEPRPPPLLAAAPPEPAEGAAEGSGE